MDNFELRKYTYPLLKWWWLLVASMLLAIAASFYVTRDQPQLYTSKTTLMVGTELFQANPDGTTIALSRQLAAFYADIARRSNIYDATMEALGLNRLPSYTVVNAPGSSFIEIIVQDVDPARAYAVAQELVNQLVLVTPVASNDNNRQAFLEEQLNGIEESIVLTQERIEELKRELEPMFSARQIDSVNSQIAALESKLTALQNSYSDLLDQSRESATNTITVMEPANLPTTPEASNTLVFLVTAGLLGLMLAGTSAFALEYLDDRLRTEQDLQEHAALATLGQIPRLGKRNRGDEKTILLANGQSPAADAYAALYLNLKLALPNQSVGRLLISSPTTDNDKSWVTANLCVEMAHCGQKVILIDANLHRPTQQHLFNLPNHAGLTTLLQEEESDVESLLQPTRTPGLWVLTSGPLPLYPAHMLSSKHMDVILSSLEQYADIIVLDTAPVTTAVDPAILATQVDGVLLIVAAGRTRQKSAKQAVKILQQVRATILGAVLHGVHKRQSPFSARNGYSMINMATNFAHSQEAQGASEAYVNGAGHPPKSSTTRKSPSTRIR